jgi:hypothetical protein
MTKDDCPLFGSHKFFVFKTYEAFEPYKFSTLNVGSMLDVDFWEGVDNLPTLYEKVEYAVLGCNCSAVVKMRVKEG